MKILKIATRQSPLALWQAEHIRARLEALHTDLQVELVTFVTQGDKILDTHLGSGSSRIASYDLGFDFTGFELDEDYFKASEKRFKQHTDQLTLF